MSAGDTLSIQLKLKFGRYRNPPIVEAITKGNIADVKSLLMAGGDPNARQLFTPIRLYFLPFTVIDSDASNAMTILMLASQAGSMEIVEYLLANGAEIDVITATGCTALNSAIDKSHMNIAKLLISRGADVNIRSPFDGATPLLLATLEQKLDFVKLLLENGANVNARDESGFTALMEAGSTEIVQVLLAFGADVNAKNNEGGTALQYAKEQNLEEIVELLIRAGASD